jgi:hypothetical protein
VTVMAVRNPIDRFVSGAEETLQRHLLGERAHDPKSDMLRTTDWWPQWKKTGKTDMPALMRALVQDAKCCHNGHTIDQHFLDQVAFAANAWQPRGLDMAIDLYHLDEEIPKIASSIGHKLKGLPKHRNQAAENDHNPIMPSLAEMKAGLDAQMTRDLCELLFADFVCFDYDFPDECAHLREDPPSAPPPSPSTPPPLPPSPLAPPHLPPTVPPPEPPSRPPPMEPPVRPPPSPPMMPPPESPANMMTASSIAIAFPLLLGITLGSAIIGWRRHRGGIRKALGWHVRIAGDEEEASEAPQSEVKVVRPKRKAKGKPKKQAALCGNSGKGVNTSRNRSVLSEPVARGEV